jgi:hypothetical protein
MYLECACYESSPFPSDAATAGSDQHELLDAILGMAAQSKVDALIAKCGDDGTEQAMWAAEAIIDLMEKKGVKPSEAEREHLVAICDQNLDQITRGRIDVGFKNVIVDYKSGEFGEYTAQMNAYAAGWAQTYNLKEVEVVEVYGRYRRVKSRTVSREDAEDTVFRVRAEVENPNKKPKACRYCGWCKFNLECPALLVPATLVHDGLPEKYTKDPDAVAELLKTDVADATPEQLSLMNRLADVIGPWVKAVGERVKAELASGADIPGYMQKRQKGNRFVTDPAEAYEHAGLELPAFLRCCSASMAKLEKAIAEAEGIKKSEAGQELERRMGPLIKRQRDRISVVRAEIGSK